ncbi:MAG: M48 family metalloprotease [Bacilli bacterium]|nr:M48 family metalloprotease [Bacilli bacterium]
MTTKLIQKDICLMDGTRIKVDIHIPLRFNSVLDESQDEWVMEMLNNQVLKGLRDSIAAYKNSELPDKFLYPQKYTITNVFPEKVLGAFCLDGDDIIVDADTISNIGKTESSFLLGHEMGHKIAKYIDTMDALISIASSFGISVEGNEEFLNEAYANLCGIITCGNNDIPLLNFSSYSLNDILSNGHTEHLKRKVLSNIYHI